MSELTAASCLLHSTEATVDSVFTCTRLATDWHNTAHEMLNPCQWQCGQKSSMGNDTWAQKALCCKPLCADLSSKLRQESQDCAAICIAHTEQYFWKVTIIGKFGHLCYLVLNVPNQNKQLLAQAGPKACCLVSVFSHRVQMCADSRTLSQVQLQRLAQHITTSMPKVPRLWTFSCSLDRSLE